MIADELNEQGLVTQRHKPFTANSVSRALSDLDEKPIALRDAEGTLREDNVESLRITTEKLDRDGKPVSFRVEAFGEQDLYQQTMKEVEIAALERLDAETNALIKRAQEESLDRVSFGRLSCGEDTVMLEQPVQRNARSHRLPDHDTRRGRQASVTQRYDPRRREHDGRHLESRAERTTRAHHRGACESGSGGEMNTFIAVFILITLLPVFIAA